MRMPTLAQHLEYPCRYKLLLRGCLACGWLENFDCQITAPKIYELPRRGGRALLMLPMLSTQPFPPRNFKFIPTFASGGFLTVSTFISPLTDGSEEEEEEEEEVKITLRIISAVPPFDFLISYSFLRILAREFFYLLIVNNWKRKEKNRLLRIIKLL